MNRTGQKSNSVFKYEVNKLKVPEIQQKFKTELRKKVNNTVELSETGVEKKQLEKKWENVNSSYDDTAREEERRVANHG